MKNKTLLKSFLALALIVTFGTQAYAAEVTGDLSSSITQGGGGGSGSEVGGTLGNGTIAGNVSGGSTSGSGGGGGGGINGSVLGASTTNSDGNTNTPTGQVLGASTVPGFPTTGIELITYPYSVLIVLGLILLLFAGHGLYKRARQS